MTTDNHSLKPCPFCGEGNSIVGVYFNEMAQRYQVACGRCGSHSGTHPRDKGAQVAITAWNTRTPPEGMVLVPVEPDMNMLRYGIEEWDKQHRSGERDWFQMLDRVYRAMIAAYRKGGVENGNAV